MQLGLKFLNFSCSQPCLSDFYPATNGANRARAAVPSGSVLSSDRNAGPSHRES
jgi:hypothetical protein